MSKHQKIERLLRLFRFEIPGSPDKAVKMTPPLPPEECMEIMRLIQYLTEEEATSVEIFGPNPDFGGPNYIINYHFDVFNDVSKPFTGEKLVDCMRKAMAFKRQRSEGAE